MKTPLKVKRVGAHTHPAPAYGRKGDAGLDLRAVFPSSSQLVGLPVPGATIVALMPGATIEVGCGFAFEIPEGFEGQVRGRSGLTRDRIIAHLGTVDSNYRGEVRIILENRGREPFPVVDGNRIAQLVVAPVAECEPQEVAELDETERGAKGFGSSGAR